MLFSGQLDRAIPINLGRIYEYLIGIGPFLFYWVGAKRFQELFDPTVEKIQIKKPGHKIC